MEESSDQVGKWNAGNGHWAVDSSEASFDHSWDTADDHDSNTGRVSMVGLACQPPTGTATLLPLQPRKDHADVASDGSSIRPASVASTTPVSGSLSMPPSLPGDTSVPACSSPELGQKVSQCTCGVSGNLPSSKEECLRLIDQIWQGGMNFNVSSIKNCHQGIAPALNKMQSLCATCMEEHISRPCEIPIKGNKENENNPEENTTVSILENRKPENEAADWKASTSSGTENKALAMVAIQGDSSGTCRKANPPFKKAKFSWQVKNSSKGESVSLDGLCEESDSNDSVPSTSSSILDMALCDRYSVSRKRIGDQAWESVDKKLRLDGPKEPCKLQLQDLAMSPHLGCHQNSIDVTRDDDQTVEEVMPMSNQIVGSLGDDGQSGPLPPREVHDVSSTPQLGPLLQVPTTLEAVHPLPHETIPGPHPQATNNDRPTTQDFQVLSHALGRLSHLERWQCQHVAKSIVDNAINKTLEEMGLSPNEDSTPAQYSRQRSHIEDAGVSQAIRMQGLQHYPIAPSQVQRINPIISHLTQVSETVFIQRLASQHMEQQEPEVGTHPPGLDNSGSSDSPKADMLASEESTASNKLTCTNQHSSSSADIANVDSPHKDTRQVSPQNLPIQLQSLSSDVASTIVDEDLLAPTLSLSPGSVLVTGSEVCKTSRDTEESQSSSQAFTQNGPGQPSMCLGVALSEDGDTSNTSWEPDSKVILTKDNHTVVEVLRMNTGTEDPSTKYLLDEAVNAAINEQGLQFGLQF